MTISSEIRKAGPYPGNGVTTAFPFAFKVFAAADLAVTLNVLATGVQTTLTLTSDYTVALNPDQNANPGGTVTYNPSGVPMPSTKTLTIGSALTNTQGYQPTNSGGWLPANAGDAWDRAVILIQQTVERLTRSLKFPIVDGALNAELPAAAQRANKVLGFDGNGAVTTYSASSAVTDAGSVNYVPVSGPTAGVSVTVQTWLDRLLTAGASLGSALVGFLQSGVGAVSRTVQDKLRDTVSVKDYGAKCDGVTDDTSAVTLANAAITAAGGGRLYFPAGRCIIKSTITLGAYTNVCGDGQGVSIIVPSTASMTVFSRTGFAGNTEISNLTFDAAAASVIAISFTNCFYTKVQNVDFLGCGINVSIDRGRFHTIRDCNSNGNAGFMSGQLRIWSTSDTDYVFYVIVDNYMISTNRYFGGVIGSQSPGIYIRRGIGVSVSNCQADYLNQPVGGNVVHIQQENDCQGCYFTNCLSHGATFGLLCAPGSGVQVSPSYFEITNVGADVFSSAGIGIFATSTARSQYFKIEGGIMSAPTAANVPCIYIANADYGIIKGAHLMNYNATSGVGFTLDNTRFISISENQIDRLTTAFQLSGTTVTSTRGTRNMITNCTNAMTGTVAGLSNSFTENIGLNPKLVTTPAVPASNTAYTNDTGFPIRVAVGGGTVTQILVNSQGTFMLAGIFRLAVGETISITYSAVPTWNFIGE